MVEKLCKKETALLQAVAFWLREEMLSHLVDVSPAPDLLHDLAQSNYEISRSALERLGLFESEDRYWRVLQPDDDQPTLGISHNRSDLDHLLDGFACHSHHVNELYQHHETVTPTGHVLNEICAAMAVCGYMEATSKKTFEWADDFGPWLVRHGAWDLDEFEPASQEEANGALATIPDKAREKAV